MSTHLSEYLSYYRDLETPGFAVLVTGKWGTGKTYQVKQCVPEDACYYVSLFGVQTVEQLHSEVFAVAWPGLSRASGAVEKIGSTANSMGGLWSLGGMASGVVNAALKRELEPDRVLIFDDLERSNLDVKDLLGAINNYVEHQGFRVIVIAHDKKMTKKFRDMKEKTFGQTIRVEPQVEDAMNAFLERRKNSRR